MSSTKMKGVKNVTSTPIAEASLPRTSLSSIETRNRTSSEASSENRESRRRRSSSFIHMRRDERLTRPYSLNFFEIRKTSYRNKRKIKKRDSLPLSESVSSRSSGHDKNVENLPNWSEFQFPQPSVSKVLDDGDKFPWERELEIVRDVPKNQDDFLLEEPLFRPSNLEKTNSGISSQNPPQLVDIAEDFNPHVLKPAKCYSNRCASTARNIAFRRNRRENNPIANPPRHIRNRNIVLEIRKGAVEKRRQTMRRRVMRMEGYARGNVEHLTRIAAQVSDSSDPEGTNRVYNFRHSIDDNGGQESSIGVGETCEYEKSDFGSDERRSLKKKAENMRVSNFRDLCREKENARRKPRDPYRYEITSSDEFGRSSSSNESNERIPPRKKKYMDKRAYGRYRNKNKFNSEDKENMPENLLPREENVLQRGNSRGIRRGKPRISSVKHYSNLVKKSSLDRWKIDLSCVDSEINK